MRHFFRLFKVLLVGVLILACAKFAWAGVNFNGSSDYVTVPDNASGGPQIEPGADDFVIYMRFSSDSATDAFQVMACKGDTPTYGCQGSNDDEGYRVALSPTGGTVGCYIADNSIGFVSVQGTSDVTDTNIHTVVCNFDRSANLEVFVDGTSENTGSITSQSATVFSGDPLEIGRRGKSGAENYFDGTVYEYAFWVGTLLTQQEIDLLADSNVMNMPCQIQPSSLSFYLSLNDEPDGTSTDSDDFVSPCGSHTGIMANGTSGGTAVAEPQRSYYP